MYLSVFEQFELVRLFDILFISFSRHSVYMILFFLLITWIYKNIKMNWTLFPSNWQSFLEMLYEFLYGLIKEQSGKQGVVYFVLVADLFIFVAVLNILGMFPFGYTATSHIATTGGLALSIFIGIQVIAVTIHKEKFLELFLPKGAPVWLLPIIPVIEFISYLFRVFSLAVRLISNMISGHLLIHIFAGFSWKLLINGGVLLLLFPIAFGIVFFLTGLEMGIALLQAYVFTLLVCIYLVDALYGHAD